MQGFKIEYRLRLGATFLFLTAVSVVLSGIMLVPVYESVSLKEKSAASELDITQKSFDARGKENPAKLLSLFKSKLSLLETHKPLYPSVLFSKIREVAPSGVSVQGVFFESRSSSQGVIIVRGVASTRESLLAFKRSLETISNVSSLDVPLASLAKDKNAEFVISGVIDLSL